MSDLLSKFSNNFKHCLQSGAELARELRQPEILPAHVLLGLMRQKGSVGAEVFSAVKEDFSQAKQLLAENIISADAAGGARQTIPDFSASARQLIQKSIKIAYLNRHRYVGSEHLLAALLESGDELVQKILAWAKIPQEKLVQQTQQALRGVSKLPELTDALRAGKKQQFVENDEFSELQPGEAENILDYFGSNLTSAGCQKKIDPVIGREEEIERIIQILSRRTKNNPLILGDPGVGKTAIVEGLAKKITEGKVPEVLLDKKIYALDLASLVAGTMYRGDFENRVKQIIEEVSGRPEVILFIDEIHNLVGAGSAAGSMDAANILKPALARGQIRVIGATTFSDYRKSIENDPALSRRFQPVKISEPSGEEAKKILLGIKPYFENFHRVEIPAAAAETAVVLSQKYLADKFLPDKAIDLIDEAAAAIKAKRGLTPLEKKLKSISQEASLLEKTMREFIAAENFDAAVGLKRKIEAIKNSIIKLKNLADQEKKTPIGRVEREDIAKIISRITGIPAADLLFSENKRLLDLAGDLQKQVVGQDRALEEIAGFIKRAKAGLSHEHKPLASFLFIGPSGVGKTFTAKKLAKMLFQDEQSLIKIDMSEYGEKFNVSKLIGAPAGYVGYKESGLLTEKVKHKPYCLVLFDEIEKANPDVYDLLLQVLEDGYLTDAGGVKIDFRNAIIIMTSNLGSSHFSRQELIGFASAGKKTDFEAVREKVTAEAKKTFKPEFLNRLDKIIYFNPLAPDSLVKIASLELGDLARRLKARGITLKPSPAAAKAIAAESQGDQGARGIKHALRELLEDQLSQQILEEKITSGDTIRLEAKNGIIKIRN